MTRHYAGKSADEDLERLQDENTKLSEQLEAADYALAKAANRNLNHACRIAELERKLLEQDALIKEIKGMRKSLISWRTQCYPDNDQINVVDRDYPTVAKLINGENNV